jgi:hypothetical protein
LFALILLIPTLLIGGSLKEKIEQSVKQGMSVYNSLSKAHSKKDIENETSYQNRLEADSKEVAKLAKQSTQRELISYDIFPEPVDKSVQLFSRFGADYRTGIEDLLKKANARSAPTNIEIKQRLEEAGSVENRSFRRARSSRGSADAYYKTKDAFLKMRAKEMSLYATANIFNWYNFWEDWSFTNKDSALEDCWYSQIAYWVYEDVVETVKAVNSGSSSVFTSGVKRLAGVNFRKNANFLKETGSYSRMGSYGGNRNNRNVKADTPEYVLNPDATGLFGFGPWTGRFCDEKIDVIYFSVCVVVSADSVFPFIKELCSEKEHTFRGYLKGDQEPQTFKRNQITVMQYWQEPIDKYAREHERYRYGDGAVVKLNLTCEYVFNCSGYDKIKPDPIVEKLAPDEDGTK